MGKPNTKTAAAGKTPVRANTARATKPDAAGAGKAPRPETKRARLRALLATREGATVAELGKAIGWQDHSVRAALTGLRKDGVTVERLAPRKDGRASRYRITPADG